MQIRPHYPNLRVLYITGNPDRDPLLSDHVRDWGCHLLRKPFLPAQLVGAITKLLQVSPQTAAASLRAPRGEYPFRVASFASGRPLDQPAFYDLSAVRFKTNTLRATARVHWHELQHSWVRFMGLSSRAEQINSASEWEGLAALRSN